MSKQIVFVNEGKIIAAETQEFSLFKPFPDSSSLARIASLKELKETIEQITKKGKRKLQLSKPLSNHSALKNKIKEQIKKKKNIEKKDPNDYELVEIFSSLQVIDAILQSKQNDHFEEFENAITIKLEHLKKKDSNKKEQLSHDLIQYTKEVELHQKELKEFEQKEINSLQLKINTSKETILKIHAKIQELELKEENLTQVKDPQLLKMQQEMKKKEFKVQDLKLEIQLQEEKKKQLDSLYKSGRRKHVSPFIFIGTLGLIWWTPFATIKTQKSRCISKIHTLNEKKLKLTRKIKQIEFNINEHQHQHDKDIQIRQKKVEELVEKIEEQSKMKKEEEKRKNHLEKELEKAQKMKSKKELTLRQCEIKVQQAQDAKKEIVKVQKEIPQLVEKIKNERKENLKALEELHQSLQKQTISLKGTFKVTLLQ